MTEAVALADTGQASRRWEDYLRRLSVICEKTPKTHIAFIGTALLARATDLRTDVHTLHVKARTPGAYSARSLAKDVLVPAAKAFRFNLGVTGREPLNNQPYFHNDVVSRRMNVKGNAKAALSMVCDLLDELSLMKERATLLAALAAFITVRREYWQRAPDYIAAETAFGFADLLALIERFVREDSEGGKRAQAVAAGLMDVVEGSEHVKTGRINDPDRNFPGDVAAFTRDPLPANRRVTRVIEVRDKQVTGADLVSFASKVAGFAVARAGVLGVSPHQRPLDTEPAQFEAAAEGVSLEVFIGWAPYLRQLFFWLRGDATDPVKLAHERIYSRLVELECSSAAQKSWLDGAP